jgi:hypothetical protein
MITFRMAILYLVLLLGLAGSVALVWSGQSRITQANFDRIQGGMTEEDVIGILGEGRPEPPPFDFWTKNIYWESGPNQIRVIFDVTHTPPSAKVFRKSFHRATPWETLQWYAKKGAAKIGVKWD